MTSRISTTTLKVSFLPESLTAVKLHPKLLLTPKLLLFCSGMLEGDPQEALKGFQDVVSMEAEKGEWCVALSAFRVNGGTLR